MLSLYILTLEQKHCKCIFSFKHYFRPLHFYPCLSLLAKSITSCICIPGCPTYSISGEGNLREPGSCFFSAFHTGSLLLGSTTTTTKRYFLLILPCSCTYFKVVFLSNTYVGVYKWISPYSCWNGSQNVFLLSWWVLCVAQHRYQTWALAGAISFWAQEYLETGIQYREGNNGIQAPLILV